MTAVLVIGVVSCYLFIGVAVVATVEYMSKHEIEESGGPGMVGLAVLLWPLLSVVVTVTLIGVLVGTLAKRVDRPE